MTLEKHQKAVSKRLTDVGFNKSQFTLGGSSKAGKFTVTVKMKNPADTSKAKTAVSGHTSCTVTVEGAVDKDKAA